MYIHFILCSDDINNFKWSYQSDVNSIYKLDELFKHQQNKQEFIFEELMVIIQG